MPFIPHTDADIADMLATIDVANIEQLFDEIPAHLRTSVDGLPTGLTEMQMGRLAQQRAALDDYQHCFIGAGAYEHHIPAAVWDIASRGEFMTAYTPYQAEASQGTLQLLYEYQTMMANLTAMDVSNASLYDGASALAEAILMAIRANRQSKSKRILMPKTVHPYYRQAVTALTAVQNVECVTVDYLPESGIVDVNELNRYADEDITALVIPFPNFFGGFEEVDALTNWAHQQQILVIAVVNPIAISLLKAPGQWGEQGADIVCGEGQPLGIPLASGGPYFGFICCKQVYVRQMPGRIIGRTVDTQGRQGFALTLQAREQHIRRSKATSNICTNQGLAVTAATIYMSLLGSTGLQQVARASHLNNQSLIQQLTQLDGVTTVFKQQATFHETALHLPLPVAVVLEALADQGIQGGFDLSKDYPELGNSFLVCTTETKTVEDIAEYVSALKNILQVGAQVKATKKVSAAC